MSIRFLMVLGCAAVLLAGCHSSNQTASAAKARSVDQSKMCVVSTDQAALQCPEGQLIFARLDPQDASMRAYHLINTIALYCNTNDPIIKNSAGVICVFTKARIDQLVGHKEHSSGTGQSQNNASSNSAS